MEANEGSEKEKFSECRASKDEVKSECSMEVVVYWGFRARRLQRSMEDGNADVPVMLI